MNLTQHRSFQIEGWAVLLSVWLTFGLSTLLNGYIIQEYISPDVFVTISPTMREATWMVFGMWLAGYIAGTLVGLFQADLSSKSRIIGSVTLGYLIGTGLRLIFFKAFPGIPQSPYNLLLDFIHLEPVPVYYIFVFLALVVGAGIAGAATYTGLLIAQEFRFRPRQFITEPRIVLFTALIPIAFFIFVIGRYNLRNIGLAEDLQVEARSENKVLAPILILELDLVISPVLNLATAVICGVYVGMRSRVGQSWSIAALSAGLGMTIHSLMIFILKSIFTFYNDSVYFEDKLGNLRAPDLEYFALLWLGPVVTVMISTAVLRLLREALSPPKLTQITGKMLT